MKAEAETLELGSDERNSPASLSPIAIGKVAQSVNTEMGAGIRKTRVGNSACTRTTSEIYGDGCGCGSIFL